jgi:SP family galactose:H+ symporter-like MFS transporter
MLESFKDKAYRRASILGCMIMVLQQLSGINVLIFYSSDIFKSVGLKGGQGPAIVNFSNLVGAICGMLMLSCFGRKTMLVRWSFFMTACLFGMGWAYNEASIGCPDPNA